MSDTIKINGLLIKPKEDVLFKNLNISKRKDSDVLIEWGISSVCNSERRRFNLTKSATDIDSFIGGHEAVGSIAAENYPIKRFALLPHSNCLTREEIELCNNCENNTENLCHSMRHAGLDNNEPSGFSDKMFVSRSQLVDISEIKYDLAPFLEPLSCVIRSWRLAKCNISESDKEIGIIGGGPIGCLHAFYTNNLNPNTKITIIEECSSRRKVLIDVFKKFDNINISDNSIVHEFDITVMACSSSSGFTESIRLVKHNCKTILFSGFNDTEYLQENYLPEIIHRYEFMHYTNKALLIGSSGYTQEDVSLSKKHLMEFDNPRNIITGRVYGLDSKTIHRYDGTTEEYDEPALVKDVKGDLSKTHIKIQYHNNPSEKETF
mgnify:CR=1 FL=1|tara:strand:+ start:834 stop:1967 length:1134 start_codon:yes stop_codon:yes gene_type:complete